MNPTVQQQHVLQWFLQPATQEHWINDDFWNQLSNIITVHDDFQKQLSKKQPCLFWLLNPTSRPVHEPRMISDFRMIHPGLGGHHPRKQDDGDFCHRYFFWSNISQISSCYHPVSNGLRRCLASWCHPGCSMLETDLVHNLNASFWNYPSQALITIILISSYPEGRQYSETLASYHHPMLLGAFTLRPHWLDSKLCLHSFWLAFLADVLHS